MGDNAVGAEIITPLHDGHKAGDCIAAGSGREEAQTGFPVEKFRFLAPLAIIFHAADHVRQFVHVVGPENQVEIGDLLQQPVPLLLSDAPADADDQTGIFILQGLEAPEVPINLALSLITDGAGIEQDQIRFRRGGNLAITDLLQKLDDPLGIDDIHLTAECLQIKAFFHEKTSLCE
jgi:hypothetical protein